MSPLIIGEEFYFFFCFLSLILYHDLYNNNIPFCSEANLGAAARIIVTIAASDEAHGIFQFSADSLTVNGTEPEEGRSTVVLQVCPSSFKIFHQLLCLHSEMCKTAHMFFIQLCSFCDEPVFVF